MVRNNIIAGATALAATALAASIPLPDGLEMLHMVELAPGQIEYVSKQQRHAMKSKGQGFIDISQHPNLASDASRDTRIVNLPSELAFQDEVKPLIETLDKSNLESFIKTYSGYETRFYESETGVAAAKWLLEQVQKTIADSGVEGASAKAYNHDDFDQISIIATIPGRRETKVVVGAHLDSINGDNETGRSPGADDNGSGTATLLESMRVLLSSDRVSSLENTWEFHWYAGEEGGLLGSADIWDEYGAAQADVAAYLNQDMTGWAPPGEVGEFGMITDFTDNSLTNFVREVAETYATIPVINGTCGYACSDHASARAAGYPAAFFFEAAPDNTSPYIHTADDKMDYVSFEHILEHCKLVTGYMYELGFAENLGGANSTGGFQLAKRDQ